MEKDEELGDNVMHRGAEPEGRSGGGWGAGGASRGE